MCTLGHGVACFLFPSIWSFFLFSFQLLGQTTLKQIRYIILQNKTKQNKTKISLLSNGTLKIGCKSKLIFFVKICLNSFLVTIWATGFLIFLAYLLGILLGISFTVVLSTSVMLHANGTAPFLIIYQHAFSCCG